MTTLLASNDGRSMQYAPGVSSISSYHIHIQPQPIPSAAGSTHAIQVKLANALLYGPGFIIWYEVLALLEAQHQIRAVAQRLGYINLRHHALSVLQETAPAAAFAVCYTYVCE
jgi:hypothetical protein